MTQPLSPIFPIVTIPPGRAVKLFIHMVCLSLWIQLLHSSQDLGPGRGACFFWNYTCSMTRRLCRGRRVTSWPVPSSELPPQQYRMGKMKAWCSGLVVSGIEPLPYEWGLGERKQPWLSGPCLVKMQLQQHGIGEMRNNSSLSYGNAVTQIGSQKEKASCKIKLLQCEEEMVQGPQTLTVLTKIQQKCSY